MASTAALGHEDLVVLVVSDVHHAMDNCAKLHDWLQQNPRKYAAANALPRVQCAVARQRIGRGDRKSTRLNSSH